MYCNDYPDDRRVLLAWQPDQRIVLAFAGTTMASAHFAGLFAMRHSGACEARTRNIEIPGSR
jgi:hypothetical protein